MQVIRPAKNLRADIHLPQDYYTTDESERNMEYQGNQTAQYNAWGCWEGVIPKDLPNGAGH